jgi:hypothetical protein
VSQILAGRKDGCRSAKAVQRRASVAGQALERASERCGTAAAHSAAARGRTMRSSAAWSGEGRQTAREGGWRAGGGGEEGLLEARGGGPKVWKRKGDSAGWPWPLLLPTTSARTCPNHSRRFHWHGGPPCKCKCSDTERSAFFTAVVTLARLAAGGCGGAASPSSLMVPSARPARLARRTTAMHARRSGAPVVSSTLLSTALVECDGTHARSGGGPRPRQRPPGSPFQHRLQPGAGDLVGQGQAGVVASAAWLCSGPDSSDTGAAVVALVIANEAVIAAPTPAISPAASSLSLFVQPAHARRRLLARRPPARPVCPQCESVDARSGTATSRLHDSLGGPSLRRAGAALAHASTAHEPRHACCHPVRPCCPRVLRTLAE